jgi:hypothetical protein
MTCILGGYFFQDFSPSLAYKDLTTFQVHLGAPMKTYLELHQLGVKQFLEILRFEQQGILQELPLALRKVRDNFFNWPESRKRGTYLRVKQDSKPVLLIVFEAITTLKETNGNRSETSPVIRCDYVDTHLAFINHLQDKRYGPRIKLSFN